MGNQNMGISEGEQKLHDGKTLLMRGIFNRDVENARQAIALINEALSLGLSPENTEVANQELGSAYFCLFDILHQEEDLDKSLDYFLLAPPAGTSVRDCGTFIKIANAFYNRYCLDDSIQDLNQAILYLNEIDRLMKGTPFETLANTVIPIKHLFGRCYYQRFKSGDNQDDTADLEEAVACLKYVCAFYSSPQPHGFMDSEKYAAFYDYGMTLYERWKELGQLDEDLENSRNYLLMSLDHEEKYYNTYFVLKDVYAAVNDEVEATRCINTALYLLLSDRARWQGSFSSIIQSIPSSQLYDAMVYLQIYGEHKRLREVDLEQFFPKKDFLILLLYLNSRSGGQPQPFIEPLLVFHLGGIASSYYALDKLDETRPLTPQEQYYYARSSMMLYDHSGSLIGTDSIISFAIDQSSDDPYYLGQLYYLKALRSKDEDEHQRLIKEAESQFLLCKETIWGKAMLDIVGGRYEYTIEVSSYLHEHCDAPRVLSTESIGDSSFLNQFDDYFHFNEVFFASPEYFSSIRGFGPDMGYVSPLWKMFFLSRADYEKMSIEVRHAVAESVLQERKQQLNNVAELTDDEKALIQAELHQFSVAKNKNDFENIAKVFIRDAGTSHKTKGLVIRYLLKRDWIDSDQYYTLYEYNRFLEAAEKVNKRLDYARAGALGVTAFLVNKVVKSSVLVGVMLPVFQILVAYLVDRNKKENKDVYDSLKEFLNTMDYDFFSDYDSMYSFL